MTTILIEIMVIILSKIGIFWTGVINFLVFTIVLDIGFVFLSIGWVVAIIGVFWLTKRSNYE